MDTIAQSLKGLDATTFGMRTLPEGSDEHDPLVRAVHASVLSFVGLDDAVASGEDATPSLAKLRTDLQQTTASMNVERLALARDSQKFYSPPPAEHPALDVELRAWVASLSDDARSKLIDEIGIGKHADVRHALCRFAAPEPTAELARKLHRNIVERADPKTLRELQRRQSAVEWSESTLATINRIIDGAVLNRRLPVDLPTKESA